MMTFHSRQFGDLEFEETHVFLFPEGIIGFENLRQFLVVDDEGSQPFRWLVSLEDGDLSFPLIHPGVVEPGYSIPDVGDATIFVVALLTDPVEDSSVNLRAPIVIENKTRTGKQIILEDDGHELQRRLFPSASQEGKE